MNNAPPTVPGIPSANSRPQSPRATAARARRPSWTAAPAHTAAPSSRTSQSICAKPRPSFTTTPDMPPSPTSMFEPPPSNVTRAPCSRAVRSTRASSSALSGTTSRSAGPPMRNEVWRARGSCARARRPSALRRLATSTVGRSAFTSVEMQHLGAGPEKRQELVARAVDVARPEGEHEVPRADDAEQRLGQALAGRHVAHVEVATPLERLVESLGRDALDVRLARRVDVREQEDVRVVERFQKLAEQILRPAVAVRLEGDHQAACEALAGGAQRGPDLLGVVPVVVDYQDIPLLALHLEAAVDAAELRQGVAGDGEWALQLRCPGDARQGVQRMPPRGLRP